MPAPSILPLVNAVGAGARDRRHHALGRWSPSSAWSSSSSPRPLGRATSGATSPSSRWITPRTSAAPIGFPPSVGSRGRNQTASPALAARYAQAFAALSRASAARAALGAAYDARPRGGRGAATACSTSPTPTTARCGRAGRRAGDRRARSLRAAADFLRESLSTFETVAPRLPRGPGGRAARARVRRAAARARRRLGGDQLLADRRGDPAADRRRGARGHSRAARATVAILAPRTRGARRSARPRRRELDGGDADTRAHCSVEPAGARQASSACSRSSTTPEREFTAARRGDPHPARASSRRSRSPTPSSTTASARSRARCSARCGRARCRRSPACRAAVRFQRRRRGHRARRRLLRPLPRRRRRLGGADRRRPGQGPGGRRRDRARPPHAARRRRLRAPPQRRADAAAPRAARADRRRGRFCTVAYAHMRVVPRPRAARAGLRRPPAAARRAPRRQRRRRSAGSARCSAPTSSRCSTDVVGRARARATCSSSTPTASPRSGASRQEVFGHRELVELLADVRRAAAGRGGRARRAGRAWPPRRAGCATTWRSWPSGRIPTRRNSPQRRAMADPTAPRRRRATATARRRDDLLRELVAHLRDEPHASCARSGRAGSARRSC